MAALNPPEAGARVVARGVSYAWRGAGAASAVEAIDLTLEPGTLTALVGPNGSGKSTLLRLLGGLLRPQAGQVRLELPGEPAPGGGLDPGGGDRTRLARRIGFLPARPEVAADYTALEAVLLGRHPFGRGLLLERPDDLARAEAALARVGAAAFRDRPCEELSSGERQRVLLARVLCQAAGTVFLDEPTSAQDPAHALELFALFAALAGEGRTVIVATHDLNTAARFAQRLVALRGGRLVRAGPPGEVLDPALLQEVFAIEALVGRDGAVPYAVPRAAPGATGDPAAGAAR